ncbi:MAG: hypothetical protein DRQ62_07520 [Gammaproteobacteria bacterium]|nr:MAG: hypothetical protein DRQ62_07520 [Gammaproteobacteria bacterium]
MRLISPVNSLKRTKRHIIIIFAYLTLAACSSLGTDRVLPDRFDYNQAIGQSSNQQMLLNLVRLRYRDVPVFLSVSSVLSQYVYLGSANLGGSTGSVNGGVGVTYIDRPTISYSPLSGEEFAQQLLTPIPSASIFSLAQSGWPAGQLMMMSFERLNHLSNTAFGPVLSQEQIKKMKKFELAIKLIVALGKHNAFDSYHGEGKDENRYLVFDKNPTPETRQLIDRFKKVLQLDPDISIFRITDRQINRKPNEVTIKLRSLLTLMGFLSHGVEVPAEHKQEKFVEHTEVVEIDNNDFFIPLHIRSSAKEPDNAFVAIEYQDYWFYIEHSDHSSKQAFGLLTYLYMLQAPQAPGGVPILTIPAG